MLQGGGVAPQDVAKISSSPDLVPGRSPEDRRSMSPSRDGAPTRRRPGDGLLHAASSSMLKCSVKHAEISIPNTLFRTPLPADSLRPALRPPSRISIPPPSLPLARGRSRIVPPRTLNRLPSRARRIGRLGSRPGPGPTRPTPPPRRHSPPPAALLPLRTSRPWAIGPARDRPARRPARAGRLSGAQAARRG
jgi:hypothetical protein